LGRLVVRLHGFVKFAQIASFPHPVNAEQERASSRDAKNRRENEGKARAENLEPAALVSQPSQKKVSGKKQRTYAQDLEDSSSDRHGRESTTRLAKFCGRR
jgi:hypothetical protein